MKSPTDFVWDDMFGSEGYYWSWDDREEFLKEIELNANFSLDELQRAVTNKQILWADGGYAYINYVMLQVDWQVIAERIEEKLKNG